MNLEQADKVEVKKRVGTEVQNKEVIAMLHVHLNYHFFDENNDDMDSYITRFERNAKLLQWETRHYAGYLAAHLKGNSLRVYDRLAPEEAEEYDKLKE